MEHIVQFAISIDDQAIEERIRKTAEKQIVEAIQKKVEDELFDVRYGRRVGCAEWVKRKVDAFLEDNRLEIIDRAAAQLAEKLLRTKAGKGLLQHAANAEVAVKVQMESENAED